VNIPETCDSGICRSVIPNVEQTPCPPGPNPVVRPTGSIEYRFPRLPSMTGQGSKLLHVAIAIRAGHQIQAEDHEGFDADAIGKPLDKVGNVCLFHFPKVISPRWIRFRGQRGIAEIQRQKLGGPARAPRRLKLRHVS